MEYIGKRISIKRTENELSIVILSMTDKLKSRFLFAWLLLWSLSGIIILSQYFIMPDPNTKTAIIVWMGFWVYFEYKILNAYLWRKSGKEKIKLRDNKFLYKRDISGRGKIKTYETDFIKDLRIVEQKENSFSESLSNSYWVIAGEKLTFDYYGKEIKFGIQLDEIEAKALLKVIKSEINSKK
ncbi:MAG: hypothetical protein V4608_00780 [Bacteroidota bacterium]